MFDMWNVRDVGCWGCGMLRMWDVQYVGCGMFIGMWDVDLENVNFSIIKRTAIFKKHLYGCLYE